MSLMYDVNTLNAAMIQAAEVCRKDMPEGDKVNAVLACFAGMKPVEAEPVVHAVWMYTSAHGYRSDLISGYQRCGACNAKRARHVGEDLRRCPACGAHMLVKEMEL